VLIREATIADLPKLRALAISVFTITFEKANNPDDFKTFMDEAYSEVQMRKELAEPGAVYLIAEVGDLFAGYARVRENNEVDQYLGTNHLELQRLYADIPWQGKGVANALMEACEKIVRDRSKEWIWLGVWEHNPKAIHYYQKHGYEQFSQHDFMLGSDKQTDLLMRKWVGGNS
jgi:ribosomal protein S18 acetylase RimI-like enzyme